MLSLLSIKGFTQTNIYKNVKKLVLGRQLKRNFLTNLKKSRVRKCKEK